MSQSILYRWFGMGSIPKAMRPILEGEGIVLADEGLGGSITLKNFRAPGRYSSWRRNWFTGSLVLTQLRFAGWAFSRPVINVPRTSDKLSLLTSSLEKDGSVLVIGFEASDFHDDWSGSIECRFRTDQASRFLASVSEH